VPQDHVVTNVDMFAVTVAKKETVAEGIASFELVSADGRPLPAFTAGAHIDVYLSDKNGQATDSGKELVRQYSLSNDSAETHRYVLGVQREPKSRGGSITMHERLNIGDSFTISRPRNSFHLKESAKRTLLFAGGIGVTPILSMAWRLHALGADFEMHYSSSSQERMAFQSLIKAAPFADRVHFHISNGSSEQLLDIDQVLGNYTEGDNAYVCGPDGYMNFVIGASENRQWPPTSVHREYFTAATVDQSGDKAFQVKLASSGEVYDVASDTSIADTLIDAGVEVALSCEQGICGTCLTTVLEGEPEHRDSFQSEEERVTKRQMTVCCSRAKGELLVLDM
jgi:vanillate O-demethylase ferredoxin subunit